jgi:hypothetical protein
MSQQLKAVHIEIPSKEKWLFENHQALAQVKKGSQDSVSGKLRKFRNLEK